MSEENTNARKILYLNRISLIPNRTSQKVANFGDRMPTIIEELNETLAA